MKPLKILARFSIQTFSLNMFELSPQKHYVPQALHHAISEQGYFLNSETLLLTKTFFIYNLGHVLIYGKQDVTNLKKPCTYGNVYRLWIQNKSGKVELGYPKGAVTACCPQPSSWPETSSRA